MMKRKLLCLVLLFLITGCFSARILSVAPFPGKSHQLFVTSIIKALIARGHQVVEYSPYPPKTHIPNHTHVEIHTGFEEILSIPFFLDQPYNIRFSEHRGFGILLDFYSITEEKVYAALTKVLGNPEYKKNAKRISHIYRDQPMSPAQLVTYWVEYVLRHRGAPHLRPISAQMPWYQRSLLDVLAAILIASLFVTALVYYLFCK